MVVVVVVVVVVVHCCLHDDFYEKLVCGSCISCLLL